MILAATETAATAAIPANFVLLAALFAEATSGAAEGRAPQLFLN